MCLFPSSFENMDIWGKQQNGKTVDGDLGRKDDHWGLEGNGIWYYFWSPFPESPLSLL